MLRLALLVLLVACEAKPGRFEVSWALPGGVAQWQSALATVCSDVRVGTPFPFRDIESVRSTQIYDCTLASQWQGRAVGHLDFNGKGELTRITLHARTAKLLAFDFARAVIGAYTDTPQPVRIQAAPFELAHYTFTVERAQGADAAVVVITVRVKTSSQ